MNEADKSTLESIERLLVADKVSVRDALKAAYNLGELQGAIRMARASEETFGELAKKAAA